MFEKLRRLTNASAALFLTIFVVYYTIVGVYAHVHIVNGVMVVHSHPFSDEHNHPMQQTLVLHYASEFASLEAGPPLFLDDPVGNEFYVPYGEYAILHCPALALDGVFLRAPPSPVV